MESISLDDVDLKEMDEWRRRNQAERFKMLDDYAEWLRKRGVLKVEPADLKRAGGPRPAKPRARPKK